MRDELGRRDPVLVRNTMVVRELAGSALCLLLGLLGCGAHGDGAASGHGDSGLSGFGPSAANRDDDGASPLGGGCGAGDPNLPPEPMIPPACATLVATQAVAAGSQPSESNLDTASIQQALMACAPGHSLRLAVGGPNNAFVSGPLRLPSGVTLWIDAGTTLYASRDPAAYGTSCGITGGNCAALIAAAGDSQAIVGDGVVDGQGGEPLVGRGQSWWELNKSTNAGAAIPTLVRVMGATHFAMYRITLHNAPKFHVVLGSNGFIAWGVTIKTPSAASNSQGTPLSAPDAPNTDGIDPGEQASDGFVVCSKISVGDDQIAIKGGGSVSNLTIAHDRFGFGHGMSIGSETSGGVSNIHVYDLSIDGTNSGMGGGSSNGIRIKSDPGVGGLVSNVAYSDVCVRDVKNPIIFTPRYSGATGTRIPVYTGITIRNFHSFNTSGAPTVTLDGYDASHLLDVTLDNVLVDGLSAGNVKATFANVTLGPGSVNFMPAGAGVAVMGASGMSEPNPCADKWVTF